MDEERKNTNTWSWDDTMWGSGSDSPKSVGRPDEKSDAKSTAEETNVISVSADPASEAAMPSANIDSASASATGKIEGTIIPPESDAGSHRYFDMTGDRTQGSTSPGAVGSAGTSATDQYGANAGSSTIAAASINENDAVILPETGSGNRSTGSGSGNSGFNGGSGIGDGSFDARNTGFPGAPRPTRAQEVNTKRFLSKRAFAIILILAMLLTTLLSSFATVLYMNNINSGGQDATNYTLTTSDETLSYKSIIQKAEPSIVSITTESVTNDMWMQNYVTQGAGSGVIISKDGYIITCEHVIEGASKITVTLNNEKEYSASIVGADVNNDIAVIKIKATGLTAATYGDSSKLEVGDQVVAIGNPLGSLSGTATTGIISALNRNLEIEDRTLNLFQTDASINPGNSGGGMFDSAGNLIGIVEAKSTGSDIDGLGFATPINKAAKIAKEIIEKGGDVGSNKSKSKSGQTTSQNVIIGIMVGEVDDDMAKEYGYNHGGVVVRSVTSKEARQAGIQEGDIIYKADGKKVTSQSDLSKILSDKKAGDKVKLSIARENGHDAEITTTLVSADQNQ